MKLEKSKSPTSTQTRGKRFTFIPTGQNAGTHITLGTNDSEENYYETDL